MTAKPRPALAPDLALGGAYLAAWAAPSLLGPAAASWLILGIELEAAALIGAYLVAMALAIILDRAEPARHRLAGALLLLGVAAFAAVEAVRHRYWWPAAALGVLLGNRLGSLLAGQLKTDDQRMRMFFDALMGLGTYVAAIGITFYLPIPTPGAALGALPAEHARWCALPAGLVEEAFESAASGTWCAEPHRALAGGALYFFASALRTARRLRRHDPHGAAA